MTIFLLPCDLSAYWYLYDYKTLIRNRKAKYIVTEYVQEGANQEVNINDGIRTRLVHTVLQRSLEDHEYTPGKDIFIALREELVSLMIYDTFLRFTKDPLFEKRYRYLMQETLILISSSIRKSEEFKEFEAHGLSPATEISDAQWNLLMTGSCQIHFAAGEKVIEEGAPNAFYYRLECGELSVQKNLSCVPSPFHQHAIFNCL